MSNNTGTNKPYTNATISSIGGSHKKSGIRKRIVDYVGKKFFPGKEDYYKNPQKMGYQNPKKAKLKSGKY